MWKCQSLSRVWLFVTPMDCSPPGSSVHGILPTRILEWVAISFSRGSSWSKNQAQASCITGRFLTFWATKNTQSRNRRCFHFVLLLQQITTNFWLKQCTFIVLVSWSQKSDACGMLMIVLSCVRLVYNPEDCSPPGSSVHGIFQARILEWVAISFSRISSQARDGTWVSCLAGRFFTTEPPGKPCGMKVKVTQSFPTLCDVMDYTVHGILQARILEWVAFPFSNGSSWPRNWTGVSYIEGRFFTTEPPGKPCGILGLKFKVSVKLCSSGGSRKGSSSFHFPLLETTCIPLW